MPGTNIENCYLPHPARIREVIEENSQIKTFVVCFIDEEFRENFSYQPGQFLMLSVPHQGEAPISISSTPTRPGDIHLSVRVAGRLTRALHGLKTGDCIGLRGPYGRPFPVSDLAGKDLLFVAGGIGLAPLRSLINYCLDKGNQFGRKTILYGSRLPSDIAFHIDLEEWRQRPDVACHLTVDQSEPGWQGPVGVVTTLWEQADIRPENTAALVCGPPLMIKFVLADLKRFCFDDQAIITTMERYMKCGVGICGHCYFDDKLVCLDGPVFSYDQIRHIQI